jgi:hypothetical protein
LEKRESAGLCALFGTLHVIKVEIRKNYSQAQWLIPVIPVSWEAMGGSRFEASLGKVIETPSQSTSWV